MAYTERQYYEARLAELRTERSSFIAHWQDLSRNILPRQSRFLVSDRNRGEKRHQNIINNTATQAINTLASGMLNARTSPARPWFVLRTPDRDLNKFQPVKVWLDDVRNIMLEVFLRSNLYTTLPMVYADLGVFGTSCFLGLDDLESLIRFYHFPIGSYCLSASSRGVVDTCYREFQMTARQMIEEFGEARVSPQVQNLYRNNQLETWVSVVHLIEPNRNYDPRRSMFSAYKRFKSCYFECGASGDAMLRTSGFDICPVLGPRWEVYGEDVYGSSSPGINILGDVRQLQLQETRKAAMIDKTVNPPMKAPIALKSQRSSTLPGDVTYYDEQTGVGKFEPVYLVDPRGYQWLLQDIAATEQRIKRGTFEDLFLMLAGDTRSNITAREIAERHEEKFSILGGVIIRQNDELNDPLIDLTFEKMARFGVVPPAPPELQGMSLGVEYVDVLAQAAKLLGVGGIERFTNFTMQVSRLRPDALDNLNVDKLINVYSDSVGIDPEVIYDERVVAEIRARRSAREQAAQMGAMAPVAVDAMKKLSETKLDDDNALARLSDRAAEAA